MSHGDVALLLIEHGANVNAKGTLEAASRKPDMLALLRAHGVTGVTFDEQIAHDKIVSDARHGDLAAVQQDLTNGADINARDSNFKDTALSSALEQHHDDVARFLIQHGADVNERDGAGISPLQMAVGDANLDLERALLNRGAKADAKLVAWARTFEPRTVPLLEANLADAEKPTPTPTAQAPADAQPASVRKKVAVLAFAPVYQGTGNLKVGYHADLPMIANCPAFWDKHQNPQGSGDWGGAATLVDGQLPPGLTFHPDSGVIDGTPRQPGQWQITVRIDGLYCYTKDNQQIDMDRSARPDRQWTYTLVVSP
jgi:hypothetical protein